MLQEFQKSKPLVLSGVPECFRSHHIFECFPLGGNRAITMSYLTAPTPHHRQPSPFSVWQYNLQPFERKLKTVICLNYHTYVKKQGKTCMVEEPLHVKQLSLNHMHKIGLRSLESLIANRGHGSKDDSMKVPV